MKVKTAIALAVVLLLTILTGCVAEQEETPYQKFQTGFFGTFDTYMSIIGYAREEALFAEMVEEVERQFQRYHEVYDKFSAYEGVRNLYYLNEHAGEGPVEVEPELIDLLLFCRQYQPTTAGMVNVAMGSVLNLWHEYRERWESDPINAQLPPMNSLQALAVHTNFDDVVIDSEAGTVEYLDTALQIDLGAVAKGYATEQVAQWLLQSEMPSFAISSGGNIRVGQAPEDGRARWNIAVQNPDSSVFADGEAGRSELLYVADLSVVTSGDYQRYYVVADKRYHHLISPETLMPPDTYRSVTVVCEDSGLADLYSTALFLLPYDESRALADRLDGVEALWIMNDEALTIEMTDGMKAMAASQGGSPFDD